MKCEQTGGNVPGIASGNGLMYAMRMDEIAKKIADRRARLEEIKTDLLRLEREKVVADAELRAYEDAREFYLGAKSAGMEVAQPPESTSIAPKKTKPLARALTGQWLDTMRGVGHLAAFGVDDILSAALAKGHNPSKDNIRSQVFNYKGKGLIVSPSSGLYKFTDAGREALGLGDGSSGSGASPEESYPRQDGAPHNEKAPH